MRALISGYKNAIRAILRNRLRASLTVLGIAIGVAAVVSVAALASGARDLIGGKIQSMGSNFVVIVPRNSAASGAKKLLADAVHLSEDDGRAIQRDIPSVAAVAPALRSRGQIVFADKNASTNIIGTTTGFFKVREWPVSSGDQWSEHDESGKTKVVILGRTVRDRLFGATNPVGQLVRIGRYPYRVIGVLATKGEGFFGDDQDDVVVMPIGSMRARVMRTPPGAAGVLMVSATQAETTERAVTQIQSLLRQRHEIAEGGDPDFQIHSQKELQAMQGSIYTILSLLLVMLAGISLIVGGIGVMNIMLVSVTERTREIGIRMAIGATRADVLIQFLIEALVLALIGGVAGIAIGFGAVALLEWKMEWEMHVDATAVTVSVLTSAFTGVLFGFAPAYNASRLDPIVALRRE